MVTAYMRDIAIIIIAVQSIVIGALIAVLILQVWRLIKMVQTEIKPMIDDMQDTIGTVRGTTTFVSDNIVQPVAKTSGYMAGMRTAVKVLGADLPAILGRSKRPAAQTTVVTESVDVAEPNTVQDSGAANAKGSGSGH
ncbi:MAG: hypothetical protein KDE46_10895 [Caldilineaceae bacterium]|nr:hypothetical protein [Caldilineaceae bacterium]MCB9147260.1 hypothetical protein [Caldilineaceae bacterium]